MSVITEVVNPADDSVALKAKGVIKRIFIKRINADGSPKVTHINKGPNAGKTISATHRYSILLSVDGNDEFVSFGENEVKNLKYENQFQVKTNDGYKDLLPGAEISVYPVIKQEYQKDGETKVSYQGKRKDIKILTEAPAGASQPQQGSAPAGQAGSGGTKIFGEILALEGNVAVVKDEKQGEGRVILSDEQLAEVSVGGRMAAFVDISTGNILNGFRAYGPAGQNNGGGSKRKSNYDPIGVETGHAINALAILLERGYKPKDELETAKLLHTVTVEVKKAEAERTGKDVDAVGASAGNAVLNGCRRADLKAKDLAAEIKKHAEIVLVTLAEPLYAFISTNGQPAQEKAAESASEPQKSPNVVAAPPVDDFDEPPLDFDDDIPF